jgi:hypothetical protein
MSGNAGLFPCLPLTTFDIKVAGKALNQRDDSIIILEHQIGFLCVHPDGGLTPHSATRPNRAAAWGGIHQN